VCCTRLAENTRRKKSPKIGHLRTIAQICRTISSQRRHVSTIGNKLVKQQFLFHMSSQYGELQPISGWYWSTSLGHPSKFQRVSGIDFVTAPTSLNGGQPKCTVFGRILGCYTMYTFSGALAKPNRILPGAKFTLRPSVAFSYIGASRGPGAPPFPLVHSLPDLLLFYFSPFLFSFALPVFLLLSIPSPFSTSVVPVRFQVGGRRRQPNLGLVCYGIGQAIKFSSCRLFFLSFFFFLA